MNNIVFKGDKCNPLFVIELAKEIIYETRDYKIYINLIIPSKFAESNPLDSGKRYNHQTWIPPLIDWIKFNKVAAKFKAN